MVYIPVDDGRWIDENFARLAEIVNDYDEHLELYWIPPEHRTREDKKPYVVWDTRVNSSVLYVSELDTPQQILAKLFEGDNRHGDVLRRLEAHNAAVEAFQMKERMDQMEVAHDYARFLWHSPLNYVKAKGKKFDSERRVIK